MLVPASLALFFWGMNVTPRRGRCVRLAVLPESATSVDRMDSGQIRTGTAIRRKPQE
jgi:hypothetical protein